MKGERSRELGDRRKKLSSTAPRAHRDSYLRLSAMSVRSAASKVDWTAVTTKLGLTQSTLSGLAAFRKRNTDAKDKINVLETQKQTLDFSQYRSVLKNQSIVDEIEKAYKSFKPAAYDVSSQIKAIEQFEAKAIENAQNTAKTIDAELSDLQETLQNIEQARPFEDLTVDDVIKARPDIQKNVETMVKKGRWVIPGYVSLVTHMNNVQWRPNLNDRMTSSVRPCSCRRGNRFCMLSRDCDRTISGRDSVFYGFCYRDLCSCVVFLLVEWSDRPDSPKFPSFG